MASDDLVAERPARMLAVGSLVPPGSEPDRNPLSAGPVAGPWRGRKNPAVRITAAGAGGGAVERRTGSGGRLHLSGCASVRRARQGHGLGRGVRADVERAAGVGLDPGLSLAVI